ncbi:MAG: zinc finger Ran-binding domain-containing protein [Clostridia bacterium]|nr:zinc finger Ran-binding domain-containing protein [Clostridia bacterium]
MVKLVKGIGILSLFSGIVLAFLEPSSAITSIVTGVSGLIVCLYAAILLDTLKQIKDGINEIRENTKKPQEKTKPGGSILTVAATTASAAKKTGWVCKSCGYQNVSSAYSCESCGEYR